jgi:CRP-like cAMP-binding protein
MAPEQARNEPIDERTDVFGLGALLYFALAGRAPYGGKSVADTLIKARSGHFEPLTSDVSPARVPRELARIVSKAMATEPGDRYATIADFGSDLRQFLRGGAEFPRRDVRAGEHIIRQGESGDEVFILVSGRARVYQEIDGEVHERGELGPGAVFGEMAILISSPRTASVVAIEDCVLRTVTGEILERELHGLKPWMAALITTLAERLKRREEEGAS